MDQRNSSGGPPLVSFTFLCVQSGSWISRGGRSRTRRLGLGRFERMDGDSETFLSLDVLDVVKAKERRRPLKSCYSLHYLPLLYLYVLGGGDDAWPNLGW
jgi:hypothetical protein